MGHLFIFARYTVILGILYNGLIFAVFRQKNNKSKKSGGMSMGTPAFNKNIYVYNNLLKKKKNCRDAVSDGTNRSTNSEKGNNF